MGWVCATCLRWPYPLLLMVAEEVSTKARQSVVLLWKGESSCWSYEYHLGGALDRLRKCALTYALVLAVIL